MIPGTHQLRRLLLAGTENDGGEPSASDLLTGLIALLADPRAITARVVTLRDLCGRTETALAKLEKRRQELDAREEAIAEKEARVERTRQEVIAEVRQQVDAL